MLKITFHWEIKIKSYIQNLDVYSMTLTNENLKGEKVASNKRSETILLDQSDDLLEKLKQFIKKHPDLKKHLASWSITTDTSVNLQSVKKGTVYVGGLGQVTYVFHSLNTKSEWDDFITKVRVRLNVLMV